MIGGFAECTVRELGEMCVDAAGRVARECWGGGRLVLGRGGGCFFFFL
mgnify:CR=1 FL=1